MLPNLGSAALIAGELDESKRLLAEALRIAHRIDDRVIQIYLLNALGCHAARSGKARLAANLLGAADTMQTEAGANVMPFLVPLLTQAAESASAALGATRFEAEFEAGKHLDLDTACGLALGKPAPAAAATASDNAGAGLLGKREADVARLVADGLTNKEIGARLFISEHTVDSHVRNILNKLGVSSRARSLPGWQHHLNNDPRPPPNPHRRRLRRPRKSPSAGGTAARSSSRSHHDDHQYPRKPQLNYLTGNRGSSSARPAAEATMAWRRLPK
jgi:DNA-binding CsgD family transcriptional regulator